MRDQIIAWVRGSLGRPRRAVRWSSTGAGEQGLLHRSRPPLAGRWAPADPRTPRAGVGDAARHDPRRLAGPRRRHPRLREAGHRRRERHRRRRRHAPARWPATWSSRPRRPSSSRSSSAGASPPTPVGPTSSPGLVGLQKAKELFFFGDDVPAAEDADRLGLVNRVVPGDELPALAASGRRGWPRARPRPSAMAKWLTNRSLESDRATAFWDEAAAQELVNRHRGLPEGFDRLRRARAPVFRGW